MVKTINSKTFLSSSFSFRISFSSLQIWVWVSSIALTLQTLAWQLGRFQKPEPRLIDGVIGLPNLLGYSEQRESFFVFVMVVVSSGFATGVWALLEPTKKQTRHSRQTLYRLAVVIVLATALSLPAGPAQRLVLIASFLLLPYGKAVAALRSAVGQTRFSGAKRGLEGLGRSVFCALAVVTALGLSGNSPWSDSPFDLIASSFKGVCLTVLVPALFFIFYRQNRWQPTFSALIGNFWAIAAAECVLLSVGYVVWNEVGVLSHLRLFLGRAVPLFFLVQAAALVLAERKKKSAEWAAFCFGNIALPSFLFFITHAVLLRGFMDHHEGDIFQASWALYRGQIPYRDIFIPHGLGLAYLGTLALRAMGPSVLAPRALFTVLAPMVWILHYFLFKKMLPKGTALEAALFALLACALSSLNERYWVAWVTWQGGIKLLLPLAAFLAALAFYQRYEPVRGPKKFFFPPLLGGLGALGFFINLEHGIALSAALSVWLWEAGWRRNLSWRSQIQNTLAFLFVWGTTGAFLFSCFAPPSIWLPGLKYHLFEYVRHYSLKWGLPLFSSSVDGLYSPTLPILAASTILQPYALLPLGAIAAAVGLWVRNRRLNRESPTNTLLLPLAVFTLVVFQISAGRSDAEHLRIGLGLTGLLLVGCLSELLPRRTLLITCCALVFLFPTFYWTDLARQLVRKRQATADTSRLYVSGSPRDGSHAVLEKSDKQLLDTTRSFFSRHPKLKQKSLFLTEEGFALKLFLEIPELTRWTKFHHLKGLADQREVIQQLKKESVPLVFFESRSPFMQYCSPQQLTLPELSDFLNEHYVPCASMGANVLLWIARPLATFCRGEALSAATLEKNIQPVTEMGHLPALFAKEYLRDPSLQPRRYLKIQLEVAPVGPRPAFVRWRCASAWAPHAEKEIFFRLEPGVREYAIPLSPNPAWAFCSVPLSKVELRLPLDLREPERSLPAVFSLESNEGRQRGDRR